MAAWIGMMFGIFILKEQQQSRMTMVYSIVLVIGIIFIGISR
ncbi:hypothetical protein [Tuberibacillus sp. Marseille-P3662]|nr:hypothetical protein [Tuberibacillus sp. Marseille-P3662]